MDPIRLDVDTPSRRYTITLGHGLLDRLAPLLDAADVPARRFVVSNALVWRLHGARLASAQLGEPILLSDGERYKQMAGVSRVYDALVRANAERSSTLITFGGGVIGDMAGFAAATYLRGIALVHVPTTLLAQVDSAVGAQGGCEPPARQEPDRRLPSASRGLHRHVGAGDAAAPGVPRRPVRSDQIRNDVESRPVRQVARDRAAVFARDPEVLIALITESCRIKAAVVAADEREAGLRRILISATPRGMRSRPSPGTGGFVTARRWPTGCSWLRS
jgi:3-dehydroquinate synthase